MRAPWSRVTVVCSIVLAVVLVVTAGGVVMPAAPAWAAPDDACDDGVGGDPVDEKKLQAAQRERQQVQEELARVLETDQVLAAEIEATAAEVERGSRGARHARCEPLGVLDVDANGAGPEESQAPAPFENPVQSRVGHRAPRLR